MLRLPGTEWKKADLRQYGLTARSADGLTQVPARKPTGSMSNSPICLERTWSRVHRTASPSVSYGRPRESGTRVHTRAMSSYMSRGMCTEASRQIRSRDDARHGPG